MSSRQLICQLETIRILDRFFPCDISNLITVLSIPYIPLLRISSYDKDTPNIEYAFFYYDDTCITFYNEQNIEKWKIFIENIMDMNF